MSIDIKDIEVVGFRHAITSMRNPMNSWGESDSTTDFITGLFTMGKKDHELAMKLVKAGTDHSKFMRDIQIKCQISAPLYWWKEMDTYKVSTVRNSCSTMHKILEKEFTIDDFSIDKMDANSGAYKTMLDVISELNLLRTICITPKDNEEITKQNWYKLIQLLPSSYIQTSSWSGSYQTLRNIYTARKNHKLDEWYEFCKMIESLPHSELITCLSAKDELIEKLKAENEELKHAIETKDLKIKEMDVENQHLRNDIQELKRNLQNSNDVDNLHKNIIHTIKEGIEDVVGHKHEEPTSEYTERYVIRIVKEEVEKLKNKIEDLFDEQYALNERIDDLKTSKINHLSEILDLKTKLENSKIVDEVLIEKTRKLLDILKTKSASVMVFDMSKVESWSLTPGREVNGAKLTYNEYTFQTNTAPIALSKDDIKKILQADDTKKHNDGYISYLMAFQAYNAKKRLNALYGTACCPIKTVSNDEKSCDNCRWGSLEPNYNFYPCAMCDKTLNNWEPKKGGEE